MLTVRDEAGRPAAHARPFADERHQPDAHRVAAVAATGVGVRLLPRSRRARRRAARASALAAAQAPRAVRQGARAPIRAARAGREAPHEHPPSGRARGSRRSAPYQPGKPIEELERELGRLRDAIKLASNENPLGPSPKALAAVRRGAPRRRTSTPTALRSICAGDLADAARRVSPTTILVGNGSNEIIDLFVRTFLAAGDEEVMADQAFVIYRMVVQARWRPTAARDRRCATSPTTSRRWPRP